MAVMLLSALIGPGAAAQRSGGAGPAPAPVELSQLADGVYAHIVSPDSDAVANAGIVILNSGVLVFDTHFSAEAAEALEEKIKSITPRPVRYLINSHFHPDHTHGNQAFAGVRQIIGSTGARQDMLRKDLPALNRMQVIAQSQVAQLSRELEKEKDSRRQEALRAQLNSRQAFMRRLASLKILPPIMTLDDELTIEEAGRKVELRYLGTGHTEGDIVLFLPQERIAFLGDLFFNHALPNVEDANLLEWMKTLREILKLDAQTFVPGHGPVGTRSDIENFLAYLVDLKAQVEPAVTRGDSLEQVMQNLRVPAKYSSYDFQTFYPANLQKMYAELKAVASATGPPEKKIIKVSHP